LFIQTKGTLYTSQHFQALLLRYGCQKSMIRKGNSYDNAVMESFYRTLKRELVKMPIMTIPNKLGWIFLNILHFTTTLRGFILHLISPVQFESENS